MAQTINRRHLTVTSLSAMALAYAGARGTRQPALAQTAATPEADQGGNETLVGEALAPAWRFAINTLEDPYNGTISNASSAPPGTRFVGAEVIITNDSEQPLEFRSSDIRLLDSQGFLYQPGSGVGSEPRLISQNLPANERTRGWVWFLLPVDAQPTDITFSAPPPTLRVALPAST